MKATWLVVAALFVSACGSNEKAAVTATVDDLTRAFTRHQQALADLCTPARGAVLARCSGVSGDNLDLGRRYGRLVSGLPPESDDYAPPVQRLNRSASQMSSATDEQARLAALDTADLAQQFLDALLTRIERSPTSAELNSLGGGNETGEAERPGSNKQ